MGDLIAYQEQWVKLVDRCLDEGIEALTSSERIWFCCQTLTQAIFDGGLISYYFNSGADNLDDCLKSLKALHQHRLAQLLGEVNQRIFPSGVPTNVDDRNEVINSWPDDGDVDKFLDPIEREAQDLAHALEQRLAKFIKDHHAAA